MQVIWSPIILILSFNINLEIAIPFNFRFSADGAYQSNSLGRSYRCQWIFAKA